MNFYSRFLRDEENGGAADGAGGGAGAAVADGDPTEDTSSYLADAEAALAKDGGKAPPAGKAAAVADTAGAGDKGKPGAAAAKDGEATPASDFDKIAGVATGKKPAEAAKPADSQPPAEFPEDKLQLGPKASTETAKHFGELKTITKTLRSELSTAQQKLSAAEKAGTAPAADLEKLRTENRQLSDKLAVVDLRSHPRFQNDFVVPKAKAIENLNGILKDHGIEGIDVASLAAKPRAEASKALTEVMAKLPAFDQAEFIAGLRQVRALSDGENAALANATEAMKNLGSTRAVMQKGAFDEAWKGMGDRVGFEPLQPSDSATPEDKAAIEAYNSAIPSIRATAERLAFNPANEAEVASTATKAAVFDFLVTHGLPRLSAEYNRARELIKAQHSELVALRGAKGEAAASGSGSGERADDAGGGDIDYLAAANAALGKR